ncbi:hypothetical protein C4577_02585 [Candidatus Parcubacteria bacterium]|nr:MAG: hypothetical protein C4577_02585 [Candidatus Parcubacteria bacterium]
MIDPYKMIVVNVIASAGLLVFLLFYRFIFPEKKINLFLLLILISILPLISILRQGTYESGDLTLHSVFLMSFYETLKEGVFPPQWAGGLCGGYGCPVFMFEYPLPYYIGAIFHFLGFSFINSIKLLLIFSFITSGTGMYFWAKAEYGKVPGFVASIFYLFAPYHLVDMHFRVSVGEVISFTFIPFLFLFSKRTIETKKIKFVILVALSLTLLILSHISIALAVLPILAGYCFIVIRRKNQDSIKRLVFFLSSILLGIALSSYYLIPGILEVKYTWYHQLTLGDFKPLTEYLFSPALFGLLFQGHNGELRLIVGYAHILAFLVSIYLILKRTGSRFPLLILWTAYSLFLFLMMQQFSKPLWEIFPFLRTFSMPWRLLIPIAFLTAAIAGNVVKIINNKTFIVVLCVFAVGTTILNWGNRKMVPEYKDSYFTHWSLYSEYFEPDKEVFRKSYFDRIALAPELVLNRPKYPIEIINGEAEYTQIARTSTLHSYIIDAKTDIYAKENTFYFPGWKLRVNDIEEPVIYNDPQRLGIMYFKLKPGLHKVDFEFSDTKARKISRWISLITLILMMVILILSTIRRNKALRATTRLLRSILPKS